MALCINQIIVQPGRKKEEILFGFLHSSCYAFALRLTVPNEIDVSAILRHRGQLWVCQTM